MDTSSRCVEEAESVSPSRPLCVQGPVSSVQGPGPGVQGPSDSQPDIMCPLVSNMMSMSVGSTSVSESVSVYMSIMVKWPD